MDVNGAFLPQPREASGGTLSAAIFCLVDGGSLDHRTDERKRFIATVRRAERVFTLDPLGAAMLFWVRLNGLIWEEGTGTIGSGEKK